MYESPRALQSAGTLGLFQGCHNTFLIYLCMVRNRYYHPEIVYKPRQPMSCITCNEVFPTFQVLKAHCLERQHAYFSYKCGSCDEHYSTLQSLDRHMFSHDLPVETDLGTDEVEVDFATVSSFGDSDHSDSGEPSVTGALEGDNEASSEEWERLSSGVASYVTIGSITPPLSSARRSISSIPSGLEDVVEGWDNPSSGLASTGASPGSPTQDLLPGSSATDNIQPNSTASLELPAYFQEIMQKYFVWSCSLCNRLFPTERILHDHQQQKHLTVVTIHHSIPQANRSESDSGLIAVDGGFFDANRANTALETAYANTSFPNNCSICGKTFRDAKALEMHRLSSPQTHRFFQCSSCRELFKTIVNLQRHRQTKHGISLQQPMESPRRTGLRSQALTPSSIPQPPPPSFKCKFCGKDMANAEELRSHESSATDAHKPFQCSSCSKGYWTQHGLDEHRLLEHSGPLQQPTVIPTGLRSPASATASIQQLPPPSFKCRFCGKNMANADALRIHESTPTDEHRPFKCTSCSKGYWTQYGLHAHRFLEHSVSLLEPTEIPRRAGLQSQAHTPTSILPPPLPCFKCKICGKTMPNAAALQNHETSGAKAHKILKNKCSSCSKAFLNKKDLENHRLSKHSGSVEVVQRKPSFKCTVCEKEFDKLKKLKAHVLSEANSHSTWKCSICDRVFITLKLLKKHQLKKHKDNSGTISGNSSGAIEQGSTAERTFTCLICPSSFHSPSAVAQHLESGCHPQFTRHHVTAAVKSMGIVPQITVHQITGPVVPPTQVVVPKATLSSWDGTQFQCFMCFRGFKSLIQLNSHLSSPIHDQKEFKCPKCEGKFALISGLVQHLESHACGLSNANEIINFYDRLSTGFSNRLLIA